MHWSMSRKSQQNIRFGACLWGQPPNKYSLSTYTHLSQHEYLWSSIVIGLDKRHLRNRGFAGLATDLDGQLGAGLMESGPDIAYRDVRAECRRRTAGRHAAEDIT